jgi:hypothetical protein
MAVFVWTGCTVVVDADNGSLPTRIAAPTPAAAVATTIGMIMCVFITPPF